jgi:hypothetical protein
MLVPRPPGAAHHHQQVSSRRVGGSTRTRTFASLVCIINLLLLGLLVNLHQNDTRPYYYALQERDAILSHQQENQELKFASPLLKIQDAHEEPVDLPPPVAQALPQQKGLCSNKNGVLLIQQGDQNSATGTLFFIYIVNHLIYAELYNLQPWIHLKPRLPCHDEVIHGSAPTSFQMLAGVKEELLWGSGDQYCRYDKRNSSYPGPPDLPAQQDTLQLQKFKVLGNGIWNTYFETTGFPPNDDSCLKLPLLILDDWSVDPGMHFCAPWSCHAWPHHSRPKAFRPEGMNTTVHEWFEPMRQRASKVVREYFKPLPWLKHEIIKANPVRDGKCLSMHIRMTDKGNGRYKTQLVHYQKYAESYVRASGGNPIFVATDDQSVILTIQSDWKIGKSLYQESAIRMNAGASDATFHIFQNETHRINTESLVDIYAMSKCDFFVHGYSAMAEGVFYLYPQLHNQSVNLDLPKREVITTDHFELMVGDYHHIDVTSPEYKAQSESTKSRSSRPPVLDPILVEQIRVQSEFQQLIHANQHPQDCKKERILMTWRRDGPWDGFTLELQDMGRRLMTAVATGRTLIVRDGFQSAYAPENCKWKTGVQTNASNSWTCLYEPISNCTESMTDWFQSFLNGDQANTSLVSGYGILDNMHSTRSHFFSTTYYGKQRVVEGTRFGIGGGKYHDIDRVENWERMMGRFWIRAQMAAYLWKPALGLQSEIDARFPRELMESSSGTTPPYIAFHIRFTDNRAPFADEFGRDANFTRSLSHYMLIAQEIRDNTQISRIYVATDNQDILVQLAESHFNKDWEFYVQKAEVLRSNSSEYMWFKNKRSDMGASIATDVEVMRRADYLVGSFASNVYRLATELNTAYMVNRYPITLPRHRTVDIEWYEDP